MEQASELQRVGEEEDDSVENTIVASRRRNASLVSHDPLMDPPLDPPIRIREISRTPLSKKQTIKSLTAFLDDFEAHRHKSGRKRGGNGPAEKNKRRSEGGEEIENQQVVVGALLSDPSYRIEQNVHPPRSSYGHFWMLYRPPLAASPSTPIAMPKPSTRYQASS